MTVQRPSRRRLPTLLPSLAAAVLSACAGYGPGALPSGATRAEAVALMGPPTGEYDLSASPGLAAPGAKRRVEFARGPFGRHTYMLDFDANERLLASTQVLTEANFNRIVAGQDQSVVRATLGRPARIWSLSFQSQNVWSYRYETTFCQWFQVGISYQGKVVDTSYGPDPLCDNDGDQMVWRR